MLKGICYVDGEFLPANDAKVSVFDRGFTAGEGVYDVTRSFGYKLFKLNEHVERLYRSLKYTQLKCSIRPEEMVRLSTEVFERNRDTYGPNGDGVVWQIVSRGMIHYRKPPVPETVVIFSVPVDFDSFAKDYLEGAAVVTPATRRIPPQCLESRAKICNKMNHLMALYEARQVHPRCLPLMLDVDGNITELNAANFFFVANGKLCTSTERNVLGGISRATAMELAEKLGIPVVEGNFTPYDVYVADEAFYTTTSPSMVPVKSLNGSSIGKGVPGPVTLKLMKAWIELVGFDFVSQALTQLPDADKQRALGEWSTMLNRH
jgi:branched-chain amino acid aminotransferase